MAAITREKMNLLRADIDAAFLKISEKHGVKVQLARGKFNLDGLSGRFTVTLTGSTHGAPVESPEAINFRRYAHMLGLKPEYLGTVFSMNGRAFELTGYAPTRRKFPFSGKEVGTNKGFKFPRNVADIIKLYAEKR